MRTMQHNSRSDSKGRVHGTKHNDRNFDVKLADHIDPERVEGNLYWHLYMEDQSFPDPKEGNQEQDDIMKGRVIYARMDWKVQEMYDKATGHDYAKRAKAKYYGEKRAREEAQARAERARTEPTRKEMTFDEAELRFYEDHFSGQLNATNASYIKNGHPERCKTMEEWKKLRRNAPEETCLQIGKMEEHVDAKTLVECYQVYRERLEAWNKANGSPFTTLTEALHVDESGAPHIQTRRVWHYKDKYGQMRIGQEKALAAAGVQLPDPGKEEGRRNNRKMTFDKMAREMWLDVLQERGVEVEREALPGGRHNRDKEDMIRDKYETMLQEAERAGILAELADLNAQEAGLKKDAAERAAAAAIVKRDEAQRETAAAEKVKDNAQREARKARQEVSEAKREVNALERQQEALEAKIEAVETEYINARDLEELRERVKTSRFSGNVTLSAKDADRLFNAAKYSATHETRESKLKDALESERSASKRQLEQIQTLQGRLQQQRSEFQGVNQQLQETREEYQDYRKGVEEYLSSQGLLGHFKSWIQEWMKKMKRLKVILGPKKDSQDRDRER